MMNSLRQEDMMATIQKAQKKKKREIQKTKTSFVDPRYQQYGLNRGVVDVRRRLNAKVLRRIAEEAWMINTIIAGAQKIPVM